MKSHSIVNIDFRAIHDMKLSDSAYCAHRARVSRVGCPDRVPVQYNHLQDIPMSALRSRLLVLQYFSDLTSACWRCFGLTNVDPVSVHFRAFLYYKQGAYNVSSHVVSHLNNQSSLTGSFFITEVSNLLFFHYELTGV